MKILLANTYDNHGGAGRVAHRLHRGLQKVGINSRMLVERKISNDPSIIGLQSKIPKTLRRLGLIRQDLDTEWILRLYPKRHKQPWSVGWLPSTVPYQINQLNPDVVHLHWINHGFMSLGDIARVNRPVVWTLHDSWAFTGGCHIPYPCLRYKDGCGTCPQLSSTKTDDLSRWSWHQRKRLWRELNLTIITPSRWLADCAKSSALFQNLEIKVIPNGLDLDRYKPLDKTFARFTLGLPLDKRLILFGAVKSTSDSNKGFQYVQTALERLNAQGWQDRAELLVFGSDGYDSPLELGLKAHFVGHLQDEIHLILLYSAADVFVAPSIQENLPTTVMEAMACGTPCVGFNSSGMPELIEHLHTGYLATPYQSADLADGIAWVLGDDLRWQALSSEARKKVRKEFPIENTTRRYIEIYEALLEKSVL